MAPLDSAVKIVYYLSAVAIGVACCISPVAPCLICRLHYIAFCTLHAFHHTYVVLIRRCEARELRIHAYSNRSIQRQRVRHSAHHLASHRLGLGLHESTPAEHVGECRRAGRQVPAQMWTVQV